MRNVDQTGNDLILENGSLDMALRAGKKLRFATTATWPTNQVHILGPLLNYVQTFANYTASGISPNFAAHRPAVFTFDVCVVI